MKSETMDAKCFEIRGCGKDLRGNVTGQMVWNYREGKWRDVDGNDGEATTIYSLDAARQQLRLAKRAKGYLVDVAIQEWGEEDRELVNKMRRDSRDANRMAEDIREERG